MPTPLAMPTPSTSSTSTRAVPPAPAMSAAVTAVSSPTRPNMVADGASYDWPAHDSSGPATGFDVSTLESDEYRARLRAEGTLDGSNAALLAEVIAGHLRSRRRFIRLDVGAVRICDAEAVHVLLRMHRAVLNARGTLILTGVLPAFERALHLAGLANVLFTVPPAAFELPRATALLA